MVGAKNYLRATVEISQVDRSNLAFVLVKKINKKIFDNVTFFDGEPLGVKVFQKDRFILQISCIHI